MPSVGNAGVAVLNTVVTEPSPRRLKFEQRPEGGCKSYGSVERTFQAEVTSYAKALRQERALSLRGQQGLSTWSTASRETRVDEVREVSH